MRKTSLRRLASATGVLVAAAALPLVTSAPAHAAPIDCERVVQKAGYKAGPKVQEACRVADTPNAGFTMCVLQLTQIGVNPMVASTACLSI